MGFRQRVQSFLRDGPSWPVVLGCSVLGLLGGLFVAAAFHDGMISGEAWSNEAGQPWRWVPYIHPPLYATFMYEMERFYRQTGIWQGFLIYIQGAVATACCVPLVVSALAPERRAPWAGVLGLLVVSSAANLRPFEQYPLARLLITASAAVLLAHTRHGGRWSLGSAALLSLASVELHLNSWFVLGPLWFFLAVLVPERRRGIALGLGLWLVAFLLSTWPGLFDVIRQGPGHPGGWVPPMSFSALTMEWSNPWTMLPLLLLATPLFPDRPAAPLALGAALIAYTMITFTLQYRGLCMGGDFQSAHHYFELIDPLLFLLAVTWLQLAWARADHWAVRALVVGALVILGVHQLEMVVDGWSWLAMLAQERG